ncbi:MAG TPA: hypothetical protein VGG48_14250 [Rhizomicrobium sp.]|jgi:hypothetical protein
MKNSGRIIIDGPGAMPRPVPLTKDGDNLAAHGYDGAAGRRFKLRQALRPDQLQLLAGLSPAEQDNILDKSAADRAQTLDELARIKAEASNDKPSNKEG